MKKRLERGDEGINELDKACKQHDIAYSENNNGSQRRAADELLANTAWKRFKSSDSSIGEKLSALAVAGIMKSKAKMGLGNIEKSSPNKKRTRINKKKNKKGIKKTNFCSKKILQNAIKDAKAMLSIGKPASVDDATRLATAAAKSAFRKQKLSKKQLNQNMPRVIPVPKIGGMIPLIPVFAGLSALGALMGGAANVKNAVMAAKDANENLKEANRHNKVMEAIALGKNKSGEGVYLKPYKKGLGVYLKPYSNSKNQ